MNIILDSRLGCIAEAIGSARIVADIGTDHGLLPIALLLHGRAERAVACDIRQGPLGSARRNAERYGVSDKVALVLTDGFHGVEAYSPDAVVISGMGGELIARIISEAPYLREGVRLFLQPMTRAESLRAYLAHSGFQITAEHLARDGERLYSVMEASFCGENAEYSYAELLVGRREAHSNISLFAESAARAAERLCKRRDGLLRAAEQSNANAAGQSGAGELKPNNANEPKQGKTNADRQNAENLSEQGCDAAADNARTPELRAELSQITDAIAELYELAGAVGHSEMSQLRDNDVCDNSACSNNACTDNACGGDVCDDNACDRGACGDVCNI